MRSDPTKIRKSRLGRLSMLGGMAVGLAGGVVGAAARAGRTDEGVARELHRRAARQLLESLGEMKGLPMKLGQMLSYIDDFVPSEHRDVYRETLAELRSRARPLDFESIEAVLEAELGAPVDEVFASFEPEPIAAASIGQVYGATLHDGREVAVKVQYPGIDQAVDADLKNAELLFSAFTAALPGVDLARSVDDLTSRLREECDYLAEAQSQGAFADFWAGDPEILVPRVVEELSTSRVLVTELVRGRSWEEMLARSTQAERDRVGRIIFRFVFGSLYGHGAFNADPHPGNYVLMEDGRIAFLDFGCVQRFAPEVTAALRELYDAIVGGARGPALHRGIRAAYGLPEELDPALWRGIDDYVALSFEPVAAEQPYRFGRSYTARLTRVMMDLKLEVTKSVLRTGAWKDGDQQGVVFLHRLNFGVASLLAALGAEADWPALMERELARSRA